jgi:acetylornithine/succinyldiaminopimelate/putrescine aminotransferase
MQDDLIGSLERHRSTQYELHREYINPAFVKMLKAIGFDKNYVRGEGCYLWDPQGNKYLDLLTGWGVFMLGRNHPAIRRALHQMIDAGSPNLVRMDCGIASGLAAKALVSHMPAGLSRVFFTNSGTESVETALKFARCATGREKIIYCDHAFHGLTTGSLAVNGAGFFRERFGALLPGTCAIPLNDLPSLEQALAKHDAAAFILEPVQGKTCQVVQDGYLAEAQRLCRKAGTLLIVDEVQTGLGRTGRWFCFQHWPAVEPDIVCLAKGLSGGFVPVGAVVTRPKIMDTVFDSLEHCVVHSNTFGQNDLAMVAALASLQVIERDKLVENADQLGQYAMSRLAHIGSKCPFVTEVRGKGLMFGIDFARPANSLKLRLAWDALHKLNFGVFGQMIVVPLLNKHHILTQVAGYHTEVIKFLPPLIATRQDMDWFLGAMEEVLADTQRVPGAAWDTVMSLAKNVVRA